MALTGTYFSSSYYLTQNVDVANNWVGTALSHYQAYGASENRAPNSWFNAQYYRATYSDLATMTAVQLFDHYEDFGYREGRAPSSTYANFNESRYLTDYTDLGTAGITTSTALNHYLVFGASENRTVYNDDGSTPGGTVAGSTYTLTVNTDTFTGTANNDTFDASGYFNSGTGTTLATLGSADSMNGGAGTDTINALVNVAAAVSPFGLTSMEVINGTFTAAGSISLANATGVTTLGSINSTAAAIFSNVQTAATAINITNGASNFTATVLAAALAGAADTATLTLNTVTAGTVTLAPSAAGSGYETLNIVSGGNSANVLTNLTDGVGTSLATLTITGAQNLNLGTTLDSTVTTINASALTGALTVVQTNAAVTTITGGTGNDAIDISGAFIDLSVAATADVINGGAGTDSLQLTSAEVAAVTAASQWANVTNIETVIMDTVAAANLNFTYLTGVTTIEFDGGIGALSHTVASGQEIQYDLLDAGNDAQTFTISGSGTTDTMTIDINGVDMGSGNQTYTGIETLNIMTSGTALMDGALIMTNTAATQTVNISGTGTLTIGAVTADAVTTTGMTSGTVTLGTFAGATTFTGGASIDLIVGSTSADILLGGAGADFLANRAAGAAVTAGDVMTGGDGYDTFTFVGTSASAANYNSSPTVTDFTVGTNAANTDFIRLSADDTSYDDDGGVDSGLADGAAGVDDVGAGDSVVIQEVAQSNGAAAVAGATTNFFKLTTGVAFTTSLQATYDLAIGTSTITGLTADSQYAGSFYDTTNSMMVIFCVDVNGAGTATVMERIADTVSLIGTVSMTAADYALIDADNFAVFVA